MSIYDRVGLFYDLYTQTNQIDCLRRIYEFCKESGLAILSLQIKALS